MAGLQQLFLLLGHDLRRILGALLLSLRECEDQRCALSHRVGKVFAARLCFDSQRRANRAAYRLRDKAAGVSVTKC